MKNIIIPESEKLEAIDREEQEVVIASKLKEVTHDNHNTYIPSVLLEEIRNEKNVYVYFELEVYPFFQKVKALIKEQNKPKGVFRYRRITKSDENESLLIEDVIAITSLFGEPENILIKRTDRENKPHHVIVTLDFGGGTMAHVEYTLSDKNQIEIEWSGIENILEFNSSEMNPLFGGDKESTPLPLKINATSIIKRSYLVDQKFLTCLNKWRRIIEDGVNK